MRSIESISRFLTYPRCEKMLDSMTCISIFLLVFVQYDTMPYVVEVNSSTVAVGVAIYLIVLLNDYSIFNAYTGYPEAFAIIRSEVIHMIAFTDFGGSFFVFRDIIIVKNSIHSIIN